MGLQANGSANTIYGEMTGRRQMMNFALMTEQMHNYNSKFKRQIDEKETLCKCIRAGYSLLVQNSDPVATIAKRGHASSLGWLMTVYGSGRTHLANREALGACARVPNHFSDSAGNGRGHLKCHRRHGPQSYPRVHR